MAGLDHFLAVHPIAARELDQWGDIRLQIHTYLTDAQAPLDWVTSVRAVLTRAEEVVVVRDPSRTHILPGGRREPDESLDECLRREVLEETGCTIAAQRQIGVRHLHHLTPRPVNYRYPYPDFLHLIYAAEVLDWNLNRREANGYELDVELLPLAAVQQLPLTPGEHQLLKRAIHEHR